MLCLSVLMVSSGFILCRHQTEFLVNELLVKRAIFRVLFTSVRGKLGKIIICQIKNRVVKSEFGDGTFWRIHSLSELNCPAQSTMRCLRFKIRACTASGLFSISKILPLAPLAVKLCEFYKLPFVNLLLCR